MNTKLAQPNTNDQKLFSEEHSVSQVIYLDDDEIAPIKNISCAIGVFDGVHLGHKTLIADCIKFAKTQGISSAIVTFEPDPTELLESKSPRKLMSNFDRIAALSRLGADYVIVQKFDQNFASETPQDYIENLFSNLTPVGIFVGQNFRFGYKATGNPALLKQKLERRGCKVMTSKLYSQDGYPVSSTRIRDLIENAKIEKANALLDRPFYIRACVCRGRQVGRTLGFPTANLELDHPYVNLAGGVYAGHVLTKGVWHRASISVGAPKTFGEDIAPTIEAHLIDFDEDIYDEHVVACFNKYLRPMTKFSSIDELICAIESYTQMASKQPLDPNLSF